MSQSKEKKRDEQFASNITTSVCLETESSENEWNAESVYIHGYEQKELVTKKSFSENIWLAIKSELPNKNELRNFELLLNYLSCPSPRAPESRAIMNASVAKTNVEHWLPIAICSGSGASGGAVELFKALKFLIAQHANDACPKELAQKIKNESAIKGKSFDILVPGFGLSNGTPDNYLLEVFNCFHFENEDRFTWCNEFIGALQPEFSCRKNGLVATILFSLDFTPTQSVGIYQFAMLPGLLAFAEEKSKLGIKEMPFLKDEDYLIELPSGEII